MGHLFNRNQVTMPVKKEQENCEMKMKRDKNGRIIGKTISKECTPQQIKALNGLEDRENAPD